MMALSDLADGGKETTTTTKDSHSDHYQFDPALIRPEIHQSFPSGLAIRPLHIADFDKGYLQLLAQLTTVGNVSRDLFERRFEYLKKRNDTKLCIVVDDVEQGRVVGAGSVMLEPKFVHECSSVGHIEDIVVDSSTRGKNLGKLIINALSDLTKQSGAYKVILSCAEKNIGFYQKCSLEPKETTMAKYY
ncbi:putative glucosamine-phosphate N-acetyltransferase [Phlyctochytrium arcticum]|nr:putative glucosamine-phosphate N-acetyltransferase [Phlyctochytrium arcticum]